ncbi:hypothetical protein C8F04DRAFT_1368730 [Mycena alexandri]|uniref:Uncharacterized protein n=1 Tax=Mycena alexandri TaxID=1745969 RepID=A0AAD6SMV4_9AGAR|nr:hypothetical protein C8F04DRAFT_1368730 [Mycena alexandri]
MDVLRKTIDGDTPGSSPPPSRLWSSVPGSTAPSSPGPFPASSSPSEGGEVDVEMDTAPGAHPSSSAISDYGEDDESESPDAVAIAAALRDAGVDALGRDASSAAASLQAELSDTAPGGEDPPTQEGELTESQLSRLTHVLERSALYSSILERQMREARARHAASFATDNSTRKSTAEGRGKGKKAAKRRRVDDEDDEDPAEPKPDNGASAPAPAFPQPKLITGATLHPYQLEGLQWMLGLDEQGISGILAPRTRFVVTSALRPCGCTVGVGVGSPLRPSFYHLPSTSSHLISFPFSAFFFFPRSLASSS